MHILEGRMPLRQDRSVSSTVEALKSFATNPLQYSRVSL